MPPQPAGQGSLPNIPAAAGSHSRSSHHSLPLSKVPLQPNCYQWDSGSPGDAVWSNKPRNQSPNRLPMELPLFFPHYYSPSLSLFPLSFPNKTAAAGSAACRTMPPAQSHPTIPGLSWDIYDTSHSCHVNPPGEGGPKSSCQGAGRIPLWKRTSLSDTRGASGISGSPPLLPLFLGLGEEQGKAGISMGWWGWLPFLLLLHCQVVISLQEFWG